MATFGLLACSWSAWSIYDWEYNVKLILFQMNLSVESAPQILHQ